MTYLIDYEVTLDSGTLHGKQIRVKNQVNELFAKCALENYLKKKYGKSYISLNVLTCSNEDLFNQLFGI